MSARVEDRCAEVARAEAALAGGSGVLVVGAPGSGRTWFVQKVLAGLAPTARGSVWIGEEVHRLDDARAERLAGAVRSNKLVPLATAWTGFPLPGDLEALCRDGFVTLIDLPPPTPTMMLHVVQETLGARLDPRSVPVFVPGRPGGDLVVLCAAALAVRSGGAFEQDEGVLRLVRGIPPQEGLRRLIHARLGALTAMSPEAEAVLDVLALAPELTLLEVLAIAVDADPGVDAESVLERLENDGIVDVLVDDESPRLRIRDSVVEVMLPHTIGRLRQRRLARAIVEVMGAVDPAVLSGPQLTALARHTSLLGRTLSPRVLLLASVAAFERSRIDLALDLAFTADTHGGGFDAQVALAAAEWRLGRPAQALERLDSMSGQIAGDAEKSSILSTVRKLIVTTSSDPAFGWDRPTSASDGVDGPELATLRRIDPAASTIAAVRAPDADGAGRLQEVMEGERLRQAAENATLRGELRESHALLDAAEQLLTKAGADLFTVRLGRAFLHSLDGGMEASLPVFEGLREEAAASGHGVHQALATWTLGHRLLYSGRCRAALLELTEARDLMERFGMDIGGGLSRAELSIASAQAGSTQEAAALLHAADDKGGHPFVVRPSEHQARGWLAAATGRMDDAVDAFIAGGEAYEALEHYGAAVMPWLEAARAGGAVRVAPRIESLAVRVQGENVAALVEFSRTLCRFERAQQGEPDDLAGLIDELNSAGKRLAGVGYHLHSAEAFSRVELLLVGRDAHRGGAEAARHVDEQLAICGVDASPFVVGHVRSPLSAREQEIVQLAVAGLSNREIADEFVLSVRTVETHLLRVYTKLGIRGRSELPTALGRRGHPDTPSTTTQ